jgi:hypothetical protein
MESLPYISKTPCSLLQGASIPYISNPPKADCPPQADCRELQFPISYDFLRSKVTGVVAVGNVESHFFREEAQGARHRAKDRNRRRCCQLSLVRGPLREKHGA